MFSNDSPHRTCRSLTKKSILLASCLTAMMAVSAVQAQEDAAPVEEDMHEFMEYVFQPTYLRLKKSISGLSANQADWKAITSDTLILAESTNLLLHRGEKDDPAWRKHALEVRQAGTTLYAATKANDAEQTRTGFAAMLTRCNACHEEYTGGEPKLTP